MYMYMYNSKTTCIVLTLQYTEYSNYYRKHLHLVVVDTNHYTME